MKRTKKQNHNIPPDYNIPLALEAFKTTGYLIVNKTLIHRFGLVDASILSNYIDKYIYFSHGKDFDGSFFLRHEDIISQLNITEHSIRKAKKMFIDLGILYVGMKGSPAKEWIHIHFETLVSVGLALTNTGGLALTNTGGLYKENKLKENKISKTITALHFSKFWELYPKENKGSKGHAMKSWESACKRNNRPSWSKMKRAILKQSESDQWQTQVYIPSPTTWLNQSRWMDDPKELKNHSRDIKKQSTPSNIFHNKTKTIYGKKVRKM